MPPSTGVQGPLVSGVLFRRNSTSKHGNVISHRPLVRELPPNTPNYEKQIMKERPYKKLLRLNEAEHSRLLYLSKTTALNQEQVLRQALMNAPLLERPTADYIKMIRQISALGNNLNQLAHVANINAKVESADLLEARKIMEQIWIYIKGGGQT